MKKIILTVAVLALLAGTAYAGPNFYVGMYNAGDTRPDCGATAAAPYTPYEIWVWILPSDLGLKGFDFKMVLNGDICTGNTDNPQLSVTMNSPTADVGWVGTFTGCMTEWTWLTKLSMLAATVDPHYVEIIENPTTGAVEATDCTDGYPINPLIVLNSYGINAPCEVDAQDSSWGAVKSMYR